MFALVSMAPKKALVNMPSTVVKESLEGLVQVVPHLRHLEGWPEVGMHDGLKQWGAVPGYAQGPFSQG